MDEFAYDAFISYSHKDLKWGAWLQRRLEGFRPPRAAEQMRKGGGKLRVFRDQTDLAGAELQAALHRELESARFLIVICSPAAAASRWVNDEARYFAALGRRNRIIPFIVAGEPLSDDPAMECFPAALREGEEELLGANIQEIGKNKAFLKTASILLDVRFNRLVDREKKRRARRALTAAGLLLAVSAVTGALLLRNAAITKKNQELSFDIYGAAIVSFAKKDKIEPEELAFLQASAEAGNVDAQLLLADCYQKGWGTEKDPAQAFFWYRRAAEGGSAQGMVALANCYLNAVGTEETPEEVFRWNLEAAQMGEPAGMVNVGSCLEDGYGAAQDQQQAVHWYQQAAEAGYDLGMYSMARCCRSGIGVEADPAMAFYWMHKLAETGNPDGMYNLALMYQYGYGTSEDPALAYQWYRRSADAGCADAMRMTGWCIENRYGVENPALEWYVRAAQAGCREALEDLQRLMEK